VVKNQPILRLSIQQIKPKKNLSKRKKQRSRLNLTGQKRRPSWLNRPGYRSLNRNALRWRDKLPLRRQKKNDLKLFAWLSSRLKQKQKLFLISKT